MRFSGHLFIALSSLCLAAPAMATGEFEALHRLIKPKAGESAWAEVPWLISLWEARTRAAAQGKPILLWEMDGHPLGCT
jgi:hypothetical protein